MIISGPEGLGALMSIVELNWEVANRVIVLVIRYCLLQIIGCQKVWGQLNDVLIDLKMRTPL